jgi:hypothetical protein
MLRKQTGTGTLSEFIHKTTISSSLFEQILVVSAPAVLSTIVNDYRKSFNMCSIRYLVYCLYQCWGCGSGSAGSACFWGLPYPDLSVRCTDPDPSLFRFLIKLLSGLKSCLELKFKKKLDFFFFASLKSDPDPDPDPLEVRTRRSGYASKCHESPTLVCTLLVNSPLGGCHKHKHCYFLLQPGREEEADC